MHRSDISDNDIGLRDIQGGSIETATLCEVYLASF